MTRSMARELGADGITVNAVLPGVDPDRDPARDRHPREPHAHRGDAVHPARADPAGPAGADAVPGPPTVRASSPVRASPSMAARRISERSPMTLSLSVACGPYDRTRALFDGDVRIEGCDATFIALSPEEAFFRAFGQGRVRRRGAVVLHVPDPDRAGRLPLCRHPRLRLARVPPFGLLRPHRPDRPSRGTCAGRGVGVPEYQVTAAVWARGILEDEYGVAPSAEIFWVTGGVEQVGRHEKTPIRLPPDVSVSAGGEDPLSRQLADGTIDAGAGAARARPASPMAPRMSGRSSPTRARDGGRLFPQDRPLPDHAPRRTASIAGRKTIPGCRGV